MNCVTLTHACTVHEVQYSGHGREREHACKVPAVVLHAHENDVWGGREETSGQGKRVVPTPMLLKGLSMWIVEHFGDKKLKKKSWEVGGCRALSLDQYKVFLEYIHHMHICLLVAMQYVLRPKLQTL